MTRGGLTTIRSNVSVTPNCYDYRCRTAPSQPASRSGARPVHSQRSLLPHCKRLTVIDVMPRAIGRAVQRTKRWSHISWAATDILQFSTEELFDLIVVAEVLYYLEDMTRMRTAIDKLVKMLAPGGHLVFGSARDATCRRWGHVAGAETVITMLAEALIEVERVQCQGQSADEDCLLVRFRNPERSSICSNGRA